MNPKYAISVSAKQFYAHLGRIECPSCRLTFDSGMPRQHMMTMDIVISQCPYCNIYVLVNMMAPDPVCIEGDCNFDLINSRARDLAKPKSPSGKQS